MSRSIAWSRRAGAPPQRVTTSIASPNIWATGPTFEIVGGPYRTRQEAVNAHDCGRQDGGTICLAWSSESQPYREADRTCAERR